MPEAKLMARLDASLVAQFQAKVTGANVHKAANLICAYRSAIFVVNRQGSLKWLGFTKTCERTMRKYCFDGLPFDLPTALGD